MNTIEKKSVRVGKYVNAEHVDTLIRNYKKQRWMQNSERIGKEDTLGVWFSAEELEEFIQTARAKGADGIRLCFGVYGEKAPRPGMEGRQTVALVATHNEQENPDAPVHQDMYVERNGKNELLAYNVGFPFPLPATTPPTGVSMSSLGVTIAMDKHNRMIVI
jgi:hypothetical protein